MRLPNNTESVDKAIVRAQEICELNRVKLTELREQVLRLVLEYGKPLGAYTLMDMLEARSGRQRVAPPTVYRALDFLLEYRLIHKIHSLNAYLGNASPKDESCAVLLICAACGAAEELHSNTIQQTINLSASQHRFAVEKQVFEIMGRCNLCRHLDH